MSNLSRHRELCELFLDDSDFVQNLHAILNTCSLRDLVYYAVGIVINITLNADAFKSTKKLL